MNIPYLTIVPMDAVPRHVYGGTGARRHRHRNFDRCNVMSGDATSLLFISLSAAFPLVYFDI